jgi:hypothetical protein
VGMSSFFHNFKITGIDFIICHKVTTTIVLISTSNIDKETSTHKFTTAHYHPKSNYCVRSSQIHAFIL